MPQTYQIVVELRSGGASGTVVDPALSPISYVSTNPAVVTVSATGLVTSVATGTAAVVVRSGTGRIVKHFRVNAVGVPVLTTITITPNPATVAASGTRQFTAAYLDQNGAAMDMTGVAAGTWASSSPSVATIDASGLATWVAAGTTNITHTRSGVTSAAVVLTASAVETVAALVADLNDPADPADVLAVFVAADMPDGAMIGGTNPPLAPAYLKPGLTSADIPNLLFQGTNGQGFKTLNAAGKPVLRWQSTGGFLISDGAGAAYSLTAGLSIHYIGTANATGASAEGAAVVGLQRGAAGTGFDHGAGIVVDSTLHNRAHPNLYLRAVGTGGNGASTRYHLRCAALPDGAMRLYSMSVAPYITGETGARGSVQRSAFHATNNHREFIQGRTAGHIAVEPSDTQFGTGSHYLTMGLLGGLQTVAGDFGAVIITRNKQTARHAIRLQQFAVGFCGAGEETGNAVVVIGDSIGHGIATGRSDHILSDAYDLANADGGHAATQAAFEAGYRLVNFTFGGESNYTLNSASYDRLAFNLPLWLNARSLTRMIVVVHSGCNDVSTNGFYSDPGGVPSMQANMAGLIARIRALPGNIDLLFCNVQPCWVDGATNPTHQSEQWRTGLNAAYATDYAATVERYRDVTLNTVIGEPGDNTNPTYYRSDWDPVDLTHMKEAGYQIRRDMLVADINAMIP